MGVVARERSREAPAGPRVTGVELAAGAARVVVARDDAARHAQTEVDEDPALRGVATARLADEVSSLVLDGRPLESLIGYHGRSLEVHTDVAVAPLVLSGAALATMGSSRRRATAV